MRNTIMAALLVLGSVQPASAGLLGLAGSAQYRSGSVTDTTYFDPSPNFTIGAGIEASYKFVFSPTSLDFDATSLTLIFQGVELIFSSVTFTGLDFRMTTPHGITGVSLGGTVPTGFTASDVTFTPTDISLNLEGISLSGYQPLVLNFSFDANPVSTPPTLPLVLAGLAGLVFSRGQSPRIARRESADTKVAPASHA